jgi:hypothetical protein
MIDNQLGLGLVFNGCIYNFQELRAELVGKGYRFFSQGDTEVILKAYHCWGPRCVRRFKGMFAFEETGAPIEASGLPSATVCRLYAASGPDLDSALCLEDQIRLAP